MSDIKQRKHSQLTFRLVLGVGALIAAVLCIQCVRTYLYIDAVLIPRQAEHEAQREAGTLSNAVRSAGIADPSKLAQFLQRAIESAANRIVWMRVLDSDNNVLSQAGNPPTTAVISPQLWNRMQKHEHLGTLIDTPAGKVFSTMLPLHMPRPSHGEDRRMGYLLNLGISLNAVSDTFSGLRQNVVIGIVASLTLLIALAVIALRARRYLRGKYLESELQLARRVQRDLQPKADSMSPFLQFAASAAAADQVGGDFYDVFALESGKLAIVVGDASGKGIPAALLVSVLHGAIRSSTASQHEFACERINRMLCERSANERFATLFWGVFDPVKSTLRYVNAGHAAPMLLRKDRNSVERLKQGGPILGVLPQARYCAGEVDIREHDTLILYTDGVSEASDKNGEEFGDERLMRTLSTARDIAPAHLCDEITKEVSAFSANECSPADDRTLLVVRFLSRSTNANECELAAAMAQVA